MASKLHFICNLQRRYLGIPVLDGGDLFDKRYRSHPNYFILPFANAHLPNPFITIPGNHDLPQHEIANYPRSAMAVLESFGRITVARPDRSTDIRDMGIWGFPYRLPHAAPDVRRRIARYSVALIHAMIWYDRPPFPGAEGCRAEELLDLFDGFDLIVVGHNHQSFALRDGKRLLVNPGSLMRADANQANYKPRVFLWYAETGQLVPVAVPIEEGVVSRDHIETADIHNERLDAFISKLTEDTEGVAGVSFERNLEEVMHSEHVSEQVREKVKEYRVAKE